MTIKPKKSGLELDVRTFKGADGTTFLVFRTKSGAYHAFQEVEAKAAARACGVQRSGTTRQMWKSLWS